MAYTTGNLILDDHYNEFANNAANNINKVWGAGSSNFGYGQTNTISNVSAGTTISATQWADLLNRISSAASHQNSSITSITNPVSEDTISAYTALSGNVTTINTNKLNVLQNGSDSSSSSTYTSTWIASTQHIWTVTFNSDAHARYFFNAGGQIRLSFNLLNESSNSKDVDWNDLTNECGTVVFTGGSGSSVNNADSQTYTGTNRVGGSGATPTVATSTGHSDLTTSNVQIFKQFSDNATYSSNYIAILARADTTYPANVLTFTVNWVDNAADTQTDSVGNSLTQDNVTGDTRVTLTIRPPSTTNLNADTWTGTGIAVFATTPTGS
jgi:hypothetical protein